jgi:hypothetical protein
LRLAATWVCLLVLGCASEPKKTTMPAPEAEPGTEPKTAADAPAFGLYKLERVYRRR